MNPLHAASFMPGRFHSFVADRVRTYVPEIMGAATTSASALTAWQAHAQWVFSVIASIVAIVVGLFTLRSLIRKDRVKSE